MLAFGLNSTFSSLMPFGTTMPYSKAKKEKGNNKNFNHKGFEIFVYLTT